MRLQWNFEVMDGIRPPSQACQRPNVSCTSPLTHIPQAFTLFVHIHTHTTQYCDTPSLHIHTPQFQFAVAAAARSLSPLSSFQALNRISVCVWMCGCTCVCHEDYIFVAEWEWEPHTATTSIHTGPNAEVRIEADPTNDSLCASTYCQHLWRTARDGTQQHCYNIEIFNCCRKQKELLNLDICYGFVLKLIFLKPKYFFDNKL